MAPAARLTVSVRSPLPLAVQSEAPPAWHDVMATRSLRAGASRRVECDGRGLFVHRNTLVYRLEKIKKLTGLDLREFDDAIVFKVALMVKKYLSSNPAKY